MRLPVGLSVAFLPLGTTLFMDRNHGRVIQERFQLQRSEQRKAVALEGTLQVAGAGQIPHKLCEGESTITHSSCPFVLPKSGCKSIIVLVTLANGCIEFLVTPR